ncbi:MAG: glycoside hydrolase family 3 N-terminal domain-containing protein [Pseudomonadota bacterium]
MLGKMTLDEKLGQLVQLDASWGHPPDYLGERIRAGHVGSVLNNADVHIVNELQRIAVEHSRLGIPLLVGRDVIHGFKTVLPIPLGQAAAWNPLLVEVGARHAAIEASGVGINWTFAPMVDITRDPRWGRIAESFGEDPYLAECLGAAMVRGFQTDNPSEATAIAACAKHFVGYGAAEAGRDYAATNIPENELRNVHLRPFRAAVDAGVLTLMTSFSDIDGVPATANDYLLRDVLRDEWGFDGLVVSDWESVQQLKTHGLTHDDAGSAREAITAGVDMEMAGECYWHHLPQLIEQGTVDIARIDDAVRNILRAKFRLGLFERPFTDAPPCEPATIAERQAVALRLAQQSCVLLKNEKATLPLNTDQLSRIAVLGPLADAPYQQMGTWVFDGDRELSVTPLQWLRKLCQGSVEIDYQRVLEHSRSRERGGFDAALAAAKNADAVLLFLGEESILSGEAHSRADINLPGAQVQLVTHLREAGKPVIAVILAGRPLTLTNMIDDVDAVLYCWHPGSLGGPAIAELVLGHATPSGKLPVSFPKMVGQIPIYYNQKNTGKPPTAETIAHIDTLDSHAPQTSLGMSAYHLDAGFTPLFPFGFGLSYSTVEYHDLVLSSQHLAADETLIAQASITNTGDCDIDEVAQLYVRDVAASVTRPVRELKGFERVHVPAGHTITVQFTLTPNDLGFYGRRNQWVTEAGEYHIWIGGDSQAQLSSAFRVDEAAR